MYWWGWRHARIHETYDYRTFNDSFYGKYAPLFSNLYEVLIVFVVVIGCGVAFATGSSLLAELFDVPYLAASAIIGALIFAVCIFGTNVVRRASAALSACMIVALLLIYVPAIATHAGELSATLASMQADATPAGFVATLGGAFMYAVYQASDMAIYVQHVRPLRDWRSVGKALALSYFLNLAFFMLTLFGLLTVAGQPGIESVSVPLLAVIDGLPGADALKVAATALISIACISTAVTFISGMVKRLCVRFGGREITEAAEDRNRPTVSLLALLVLLPVTFIALVVEASPFLNGIANGTVEQDGHDNSQRDNLRYADDYDVHRTSTMRAISASRSSRLTSPTRPSRSNFAMSAADWAT